MAIKKAEVTLQKAKKQIIKNGTKISKKQIEIPKGFKQPNESAAKIRTKVVRDFSIPLIEYQKITSIKELCLKAGIKAKRREILRAGLKVLGQMSNKQILVTIADLTNNTAILKLDS